MGLFADERYPMAERMSQRGFYLPSGLALTDEKQDRVVGAVKQLMESL
jgi:perosamine synthetase